MIVKVCEEGYINEEIQVSRSLGDFDAKFIQSHGESDSANDDENDEENNSARSNVAAGGKGKSSSGAKQKKKQQKKSPITMTHSMAVSPTPAILEVRIDWTDVKYVVLACDGLFEGVAGNSSRWIGRVIRQHEKAASASSRRSSSSQSGCKVVEEIAAALVEHAVEEHCSEDNISAVVVSMHAQK